MGDAEGGYLLWCATVGAGMLFGVGVATRVRGCLRAEGSERRATVAQLLAHPFVAGRDVQSSHTAVREIIVETMYEQ